MRFPTTTEAAPVRRLWVRWALLVLFVAVLGTVFVRLGEWQLDRLTERRARNEVTVTNEQAAVRPYAEVFTRPITDADQWSRVSAVGRFDAEHQFVVRYRHNTGPGGDQNGYEIVTPLITDSGAILVSRGFVALAGGQRIPEVAPPPPAGQVSILGHVRRNEQGRRGAITPTGGQVRLINSDAIGATLPYPVANGYVGLISIDPPQAGGLEPIALPEISEGPHFWYAVQWFMFAGIGIAGIAVFIRSDLRERRKATAGASRSTS